MHVQRDCNACGKEGFSSRLVSEEAFVIIEEEIGSSRGKETLLNARSVHAHTNYTMITGFFSKFQIFRYIKSKMKVN